MAWLTALPSQRKEISFPTFSSNFFSVSFVLSHRKVWIKEHLDPESGCQVTSCSQGRFAASVGTWRWAEIRPWIRGCLNHRFRIPSRCCRSDDYYTKNLYHPSWTYISDTKWATTVWNFASRYCLLTQAEMLRSFVGNWVVTVIN